ncbi:hypothetical protein KI387_041050, partial [Taxus chinensis]
VELIELFTRACAKHISPTLQIQTFRTFDEAFTMARKLEIRALEEEKLRLRNKNPNFRTPDSTNKPNTTNPHPSTASKSKGAVHAVMVKSQPPSNTPPKTTYKYKAEPINYTPLGETYGVILEKLLKAGAITLPPVKPHSGFDSTRAIPSWYKENDFCNFHRVKGHSHENCKMLKNIVQEMVDAGDITLDNPNAPANRNLKIFNKPFPNHSSNSN